MKKLVFGGCCKSCQVRCVFFFSSRRRHTRFDCDWSSDVCSSDLGVAGVEVMERGTTLTTMALLAEPPNKSRTAKVTVADAAVIPVPDITPELLDRKSVV